MSDFFKNLRDDPDANVESIQSPKQNADIGTRPIKEDGAKTLEQVITKTIIDVDEINAELKEISEHNKAAIEELRSQSTLKNNEDIATIIKKDNDLIKGMEKVKIDDIVDIQDVSVKLNEITKQSNAALEDLKIESNKIIDMARIQSNEVLIKAKASFSVLTKASHNELPNETPPEVLDNAKSSMGLPTQPNETKPPEEEPPVPEERAAIKDNIMAYLN